MDELPILEVYAVLTQSGLPQSEFWKSLRLSSRDGSRILRKLLRNGKITREPLNYRGRVTYLIKATDTLSIQELKASLLKSNNEPLMNFIAPDLTPRISQAVDLRKQNLTIREVAEKMGIAKGTVDIYLHAARNPEAYYDEKEKRKNKKNEINPENIKTITNQIKEKGYCSSVDFDKISESEFKLISKHLCDIDEFGYVSFPFQKKYWGSMAGKVILYLDRRKVSQYIASIIGDECFPNIDKLSRRGGGKYESYSTFACAINNRLGDVFSSDKETLEACKILIHKVKKMYNRKKINK